MATEPLANSAAHGSKLFMPAALKRMPDKAGKDCFIACRGQSVPF
jgi:hypothetical protein